MAMGRHCNLGFDLVAGETVERKFTSSSVCMGLQRKGLRAHSQQLYRPTENYNPMEKTNKLFDRF